MTSEERHFWDEVQSTCSMHQARGSRCTRETHPYLAEALDDLVNADKEPHQIGCICPDHSEEPYNEQ